MDKIITLYTGTPGSGKSLHATGLVLRMLAKKKYVIANFALSFTPKEIKRGYDKYFFYMQNSEITVETLVEFAIDHNFFKIMQESQALVVIDEAGGRFNCRETATKNSDRAEWIDLFSQHRKIGYDFILVAQNDRMLDRQIRGYIETEKKHRKVNNFGPLWLLPFPAFIAIEHWYTAKLKVGSEMFLFSKKVANHYDSMKMFSGFKLSQHLLDKIEASRTNKKIPTPEGMDVPISAIYDEKEGL